MRKLEQRPIKSRLPYLERVGSLDAGCNPFPTNAGFADHRLPALGRGLGRGLGPGGCRGRRDLKT